MKKVALVLGTVLIVLLGLASFAEATSSKKQQFSFSDKNLKEYLQKNPRGVIYMVSPHMYLSIKGLAEYEKIAKSSQVSFLALLDPMTNTRKNSFGGDLSQVRSLASSTLIQKDATVHYPAYIFHKDGVLQNRFNPGYDAPEKFEKNLKEFFR